MALEVSGVRGQRVSRLAGSVDGGALSLLDLEHCEVIVLDHVGQATLEGLVGCKIFLGPCQGPCFLRKCRGCTVTVACKQLRVVDCIDCTFFANVKSDPVLEGSQEIVLAPFNAEMVPALSKLAERAGLDLAEEGKWRSVFDFSEDEVSERNWRLMEANQPLLDVRTMHHSPLGVAKLRDVFWDFDQDRDGSLSFEEVNRFQRAVGSDEVVSSKEEMQAMFAEVGLPLDARGGMPFSSFLELYRLQGEDELLGDLSKLGVDRVALPTFNLGAVLSAASAAAAGDKAASGDKAAEEADYDDDFEDDDFEDDDDDDDDDGFGLEEDDFGDSQAGESKRLSASPIPVVEGKEGKEGNSTLLQMQLRLDDEDLAAFDSDDDGEEGGEGEGEGEGEGGGDTIDAATGDLAGARAGPADDILTCAAELCVGARHRGVNLQKWFANYGEEGQLSLPRQAFETAFSALLLGLCAGSSATFVQNVEHVLDPGRLDALCEALADATQPDQVCYMPLIARAKQQQTSAAGAASPRKRKQGLNSTILSLRSGEPLCTVSQSVQGYLGERFQADKEEAGELFDTVKLAIQAWKWSEGGRVPTRVGGAWTSTGEYISVVNLRNAFRACLAVDFTLAQVDDFACMVEDFVESIMEARSRIRLQDALASLGHAEKATLDDEHLPEEAFSPARRLITVAAIVRWLGSQRLERAIPRTAWLAQLKERSQREDSAAREQLDAALAGDLAALEALSSPEARPQLERLLAATVGSLPEWAVAGEAKARAQEALAQPATQFTMRKRVVRLVNEAGGNSLSMAKAQEQARAELLAELALKEERALRAGPGPVLELFLQFARGRSLGTASGSFEAWMRERENERTKKQRALHRWNRRKANSVRAEQHEGQWQCLASDYFDRLRALMNRSCEQLRDERGFIVCRSSRYEGLDVEHAITALVKERDAMISARGRSAEEVQRERAAVAAGEFLLSIREGKRHFDKLLRSLLADQKTHAEAQALLDPTAAAQRRLDAELASAKGRSRLASLSGNVDGTEDEKRARMAAAVEESLLKDLGFTKVRSREQGEQLVAAAIDERRTKAAANFKAWRASKAREERQRRRAAKQSKEEQEREAKARKKQSRREYRRWRRAAGQNKYYTYAKPAAPPADVPAPEQSPRKPRRVLKSRNSMATSPRRAEDLLSRPEWVQE